ncbi:hypothetical protein ACQP1O_43070 (plasmid) [Nocardia sp. CA-151230]|uniref:hypothetical protein n=1 Tax=Nocardia sp. CA-151230 TaxID=3239982 RepID=UPI003D950047
METSPHPAIDVALGAVSGRDRAARLVAAVERGDTVAVLVDTPDARAIVFIERDGTGQWVAPSLIGESPCRHTTRAATTRRGYPLNAKQTKRVGTTTSDTGWFGLTGYAAADAVAVTVASSLDTHRVDVADDGLVLAAVRARLDEDPVVVIHLASGENIIDPR